METINMRRIAIYGAGGLGRETACLIKVLNNVNPHWDLIGFFDDGKPKGASISHFGSNLGGIEEVNSWDSDLDLVLAFGNPQTLHIIRKKISNPHITFPNLIHPSFHLTDPSSFKIGVGNIIQYGSLATTDVSIGDFNLFNGNVSIGHDTTIGNYNVLMPGVKVSGEVSIGDCNLLGASSFIMQQISIGSGVTLSPLSALLKKPKDNNIYIGNPAKLLKL